MSAMQVRAADVDFRAADMHVRAADLFMPIGGMAGCADLAAEPRVERRMPLIGMHSRAGRATPDAAIA